MIDNLTQEQIEVLFEYVEFTKRDFKPYHPLIKKAMLYDYKYGKGEAVELLNSCFYDLIKIEKLNIEEIRELAMIVSQREIEHEVDPSDIFNPNNEELNKINKRNREKEKTNGQEYI